MGKELKTKIVRLLVNIISGMAAVSDVLVSERPKISLYNHYVKNKPTDSEVIYSDWKTVGDDMIGASKKMANARR